MCIRDSNGSAIELLTEMNAAIHNLSSSIQIYSSMDFRNNRSFAASDDLDAVSEDVYKRQPLRNISSLSRNRAAENSSPKECAIPVRSIPVSYTHLYLCKYQNHYVKHNDAVNPEEIDYIIEQTSATINFLIKVK